MAYNGVLTQNQQKYPLPLPPFNWRQINMKTSINCKKKLIIQNNYQQMKSKENVNTGLNTQIQ